MDKKFSDVTPDECVAEVVPKLTPAEVVRLLPRALESAPGVVTAAVTDNGDKVSIDIDMLDGDRTVKTKLAYAGENLACLYEDASQGVGRTADSILKHARAALNKTADPVKDDTGSEGSEGSEPKRA